MCGIAGILGSDDPKNLKRLSRMVEAQRHRGPDASLIKVYPQGALGFARLSIIDLSAQAMQPMESADGRYVLVFNGEIYNYKELQKELSGRYQFKSRSDSEVLLAAYQDWGKDCLHRLRGMFAFCIFDRIEKSAFFARDRFGQKQLYFYEEGSSLIFASEIKAILAAGVEPKANMESWRRYLLYASYDDTKDTFFSGISQLQPGECMYYAPDSGIKKSFYYRLGEHVKPLRISELEAARKVRELMVDSARIHMRADVPIAVSLSGGLDSSALLTCFKLAGELNPKIHLFSVEFGPDFSERPWIEAAAQYHSLQSQIDTFDEQQFLHSIKRMVWQQEGPIGGLITCALLRVMESARNNGFKVIQSGNGLDECFAGYRNHHNLYIGMLLQGNSPKSGEAIKEYAQNWGVSEGSVRTAALSELKSFNSTIDGTIPTRPELVHPDIAHQAGQPEIGLPAYTGDRLRDTLIDYLQVCKIPRNTRLFDRLSMAYSLEMRMPFLDHRLIEFALSLPLDYYFLHGRTKSIVREAFSGVMDETVRIAVKRSIQAPQGVWLRREPMRSYIKDILKSESFAERKLFDIPKSLKAYDDFCNGKGDNSFFIWQMINAEVWFRSFVDSNPLVNTTPLCEEYVAG